MWKLNYETAAELADKYKPCLVLFPEHSPSLTETETDFYPRSVELFLEQVRLGKGAKNWFKLVTDWHKKTITTIDEIKNVVKTDPTCGRGTFLDIPGIRAGDEKAARKAYLEILASGLMRYPVTAYARVISGDEPFLNPKPKPEALCVQYWFFYFYNDFWNDHEGDWEMVTILLSTAGPQEPIPVGIAYSGHYAGLRRPWTLVSKVQESHVVCYVAKGSHANYFSYRPEGYPAETQRAISLPFAAFKIRIPSSWTIKGRKAIDYVPPRSSDSFAFGCASAGVELLPQVQLLPSEQSLSNPTVADKWWWLFYRGLWGSPGVFKGGWSGPEGPREQGIRWWDPFYWAEKVCGADEVEMWPSVFVH